MEKREKLDLPRKAFFISLIVFTLFKLYYATILSFSHDEAYHWVWSRHLAFGYYDHPPVVAWLIAFFERVGGHSLFWTRFPAILCVTGAIYLIYRLAYEMGGERVGIAAGFIALTSAVFTIGAVIITTDSPLIFFWQLTAYLVFVAIKTKKQVFWYIAGIALGFGMLSKFLIFPLVLGVFLFLLFSKEDRFWLRRKEPYLALGIALVMFIPFLVWNSQHGWATFAFNLKRHDSSLNPLAPLEYVVLQALLLCPVIYGILIWSFIRIIRRLSTLGQSIDLGEKRLLLYVLACGWLLPVLFFLQSVKNPVDGHWPMTAYGVIFAGAAYELVNRYQEKKRSYQLILNPRLLGIAFIWTCLLLVLTFNINIILKNVLGRNVNLGYDYPKLAQKVEQIYYRNGKPIIATTHYAFSSFLSFYLPKYQISMIGPGEKYGRAYDLWDHWDKWVGRDVLLVSDKPITPTSFPGEVLRQTCTSYKLLPPLNIRENGRWVWSYYFALGHHLKPDPYKEIRQNYRF